MTDPLSAGAPGRSPDPGQTPYPPGPAAPVASGSAPAATPLRAFLERAAAILDADLPKQLWIEASVLGVKVASGGYTLELVDPAPPPAPQAQLRAFLSDNALRAIERHLGTSLDPLLLTGVTTCFEIAPSFHVKWHLQARITALASSAVASLHSKAVERLRASLRNDGLYDRQRRLPAPADITRLVVIHPAGAAGYADIASELARWERHGIAKSASITVPFEGPGAPSALAGALRQAALPIGGSPPDLILVVRGGGAKAALFALDSEVVVMAICSCPIPILTGTGHSVDRTLADETAWRATDTPSKAVAAVADLIANPARRARADMAMIHLATTRELATARQTLALVAHQMAAGRRRCMDAAHSALAECDAKVKGGLSGAVERCGRLEAEAGSLLTQILTDASHRIARGAHEADQIFQTAIRASRGQVRGADDGTAIIATVQSSASSILHRQERETSTLIDAVETLAQRQLTGMMAELQVLQQQVTLLSPHHVLRRGFALVTDASSGSLITTAKAAKCQRRLRLVFADGDLATVVECLLA